MKASNPVVMVQAYRLLVAEMYVNGWDYPLHLGVTEAGEGEDGRMKSAIGIGTLLQVALVQPAISFTICILKRTLKNIRMKCQSSKISSLCYSRIFPFTGRFR